MIKAEGAGRDDMYKDKGAGWEKEVRRIKGGGKRESRWVKENIGGKELDLYCDTGSNITIITPAMYMRSMSKVVAAKSYLRAWGSDEYLDTKGMFKMTLTTSSGVTKRTWVYVVAGASRSHSWRTVMQRTWVSSASTQRGAFNKDLTRTTRTTRTS